MYQHQLDPKQEGKNPVQRQQAPTGPQAANLELSPRAGLPEPGQILLSLQGRFGNRYVQRVVDAARQAESADGKAIQRQPVLSNDLFNRNSAVSSPKPTVEVQEIPFSEERARDWHVSEEAQQLLAKNSVALAPAGALAQVILNNHYGLTFPEAVDVVIGAKKSGDHWNPYIRDLNGRYSRQARILPHQTDIPSAAVATQATFQAMIASLNALGNPGNAHNYYSLAAVVAHESKHAHKLLPALNEAEERIKVRLAEFDNRVAIAGAPTEVTAVQQIRALPNYNTRVVRYGWNQWVDIVLQKVADDHTGNGPCELAEKSITVPLAAAIQARAVQQGWVAPPQQVAGGAAPGGVAAIAAQVQAPAPAPIGGMPAPVIGGAQPGRVAEIAGQLQAPAPAPASSVNRPEPRPLNIRWPPEDQ